MPRPAGSPTRRKLPYYDTLIFLRKTPKVNKPDANIQIALGSGTDDAGADADNDVNSPLAMT